MSHPLIAPVVFFTVSALACACWAPVEPSRIAEVEVVELSPREDVALDAPVSVLFSAPVAPPVGRWPIVVMRADGRSAPTEVELLADGGAVVLRPVPLWPSAEQLTVLIGRGLLGAAGEPVTGASEEEPLLFSTRDVVTPAAFALEGPAPGLPAPTNLRRVVLAFSGGAAAGVESVTLTAEHHTLLLPVIARDDRGRILAELPAGSPPLTPRTPYRVEVVPAIEPMAALHARVLTGSVADHVAPELRLRDVDRGGATVRIVVEADEPVLAHGRVTGPDGTVTELRAPLVPAERVELWSERPLSAQTAYRLRVGASDHAGNEASPLEVAFVTPAEVRVELTEVVATPLHDWGDATRGVPFDATPGRGAVTDADEWLELVNRSDGPIDLTQVALGLRLLDATPVEHDVAAAAHLHFGRGGEPRAWGVGEALVVRPRGALPQREVIIEVVWGDRVLDRVAIGRDPEADHAGGAPPDLEHEAIARDGPAWRWCTPTPGDPLPGRCLR